MRIAYEQYGKLKIFLNLFVLGFSLYGIIVRDYSVHQSSPLERLLIDSLAPAQKQVAGIKNYFSSIFEHYLANISASKKNITLLAQVEELKGRIFHYDGIIRENMRLKKLLSYGEHLNFKKVLARVVATDASSDYRVIRINKGLKHGIKLQSAVLTPRGVVGYVYRLTNSYADVLTIIDSNSRVDTLIRRIRVNGILEGQDNKKCIMKYVSRTEPIVLGDKVVTSGLGNIYPKGLFVGTVSKIERASYGITQKIEIQPNVSFDQLEEVFVLVVEEKSRMKEEWEALEMLEMEENGK